MRKLFIQFYLLLMASFLLMALVIGGVYRLTFERTMDKSLDDLMQGALSLLRNELRHTPPDHWADQLSQLDSPLSFDIQIQSLSSLQSELNSSAQQPLLDGDIIMLEDQDRFLQRIPDSDYVMEVGPISYLSFMRELHWLDFLVLGLLGLSLALPVFIWMRPHWRDLIRLERVTQQFGEGDLQIRSHLPGTSSLHRLGAAFDRMATNLQTLIASRQRLTSGIAHELRTPLVRLRYRLELEESLPASEKAKMTADLDAVDRLIDEMLTYARLEHPTHRLVWESWVAAPWLQHLVDNQWQALAGAIHLQILLPDPDIIIQGDKRLIERALDNLVNNGLRYAKQRLHITLQLEKSCAVLTVEDDGPGIPEEAREQIFEPFTRLDPSRDRHTGGCGLGLAIVDGVMRTHAGTVQVSQATLGGADFILRWPQEMPATVHLVTNGHPTSTEHTKARS